MTSQIDLLFSYRITPGQEGRFEDYLDKVLPVTETDEPYILEYELFRRADGVILQHERYLDESAITKHLELTADGQADWGAAVELLDLHVIGELSDEWWARYDGPLVQRYQRFRQVTR